MEGEKGENDVEGEKGENDVEAEKGENDVEGEKGENDVKGEKSENDVEGEKGENDVEAEKSENVAISDNCLNIPCKLDCSDGGNDDTHDTGVVKKNSSLPSITQDPTSPLTTTPQSRYGRSANRLLTNKRDCGGNLFTTPIAVTSDINESCVIQETPQASYRASTSIGDRILGSSFEIADSENDNSVFFIPSSMPAFVDSDIVKG